jgi:signal transduction histidine kinase
LVGIGAGRRAGTITRVGAVTPEHRWLLPAVLTVEPGAGVPARRTTRDWTVDAVAFSAALGWTALVTADLAEPGPGLFSGWAATPAWLVGLDLLAGAGAAVLLWWRRRWPVGLFLALLPLGLFSLTAPPVSGIILLFTVAVHRRPEVAVGLAAAWLATSTVMMTVIRPDPGTPALFHLTVDAAVLLIVVLAGTVVRARRLLVASLRERAARAEAEQQLRVAEARARERTRIAREMHDVLAHRISLLSLHAGALEIRPDAPPAEVTAAAGVIRANAHRVLQDLREVVGVLRVDPDGNSADPPEPPQPTLDALPALVDESRAAGTRVDVELAVAPDPPDGTARAAYRIVQEGLTNARKHAPGTAVRVTVRGAPGDGLTVDVRNPPPLGPAPPATVPGTGTGLVGLAERAQLAGGRLEHARTADGGFALTARLPWPA